jgi:hypothetical protein
LPSLLPASEPGTRLEINPRGNKICSTQNSLPRCNYPNYPVAPNYPGNHLWGKGSTIAPE